MAKKKTTPQKKKLKRPVKELHRYYSWEGQPLKVVKKGTKLTKEDKALLKLMESDPDPESTTGEGSS